MLSGLLPCGDARSTAVCMHTAGKWRLALFLSAILLCRMGHGVSVRVFAA